MGGMHCRVREQPSHTTRPHARQWCRVIACWAAEWSSLLVEEGASAVGSPAAGGGLARGSGLGVRPSALGGVLGGARGGGAPASSHRRTPDCSHVNGEPQQAQSGPASRYERHGGGASAARSTARTDLIALRYEMAR